MVDAISRLFGKSSKKNPQSPSSGPPTDAFASPDAANVSGQEDDGFTILGPARGDRPNSYQGATGLGYPVLPGSDATVPYPPNPMRGGAGPGGGNYPTGTMASQSSVTMPSALDGVPFQLSAQVSTNRGRSQSRDDLLDEVGARLEAAQQLIHSSNYDFRLEKSVIESDISATMRRMQTY